MTIRAARPGAGRRTKYIPGHATSLRAHFEQAVQAIDAQLTAGQRDNLYFPTVASWLRSQGLAKRTGQTWALRHSEFAEARAFGRQIQTDLNLLAREFGLRFILREPQTVPTPAGQQA